MIILGTVEMNDKYNRNNDESKHAKARKQRMQISLENARPLFHFVAIKDNQRQIHCLYEDSTLIVFNESGKIITIILLGQKRLKQYIKRTEFSLEDFPGTLKCAKIHDELVSNNGKIKDESILEIRNKKSKYINVGWYFILDSITQGGPTSWSFPH